MRHGVARLAEECRAVRRYLTANRHEHEWILAADRPRELKFAARVCGGSGQTRVCGSVDRLVRVGQWADSYVWVNRQTRMWG